MNTPPILSVSQLVTQFRTSEGIVHAVNGLSFQLHQDEILGVVGESGCGKSVTMLSILRLIHQPPARILSGEALFQGQDLLKMNSGEIRNVRGRQISMVFQDPLTCLNPVLTVGLQLTEPLHEHMGMKTSAAQDRAVELLQMVGIPIPKSRLKDYPHQLSGGMRQRVMIAMALACMPKILIADEPTTALDVTVQAQIIRLVKQLHKDLGMAIIWITHDLGVVAGLADRVIVMYAGTIFEEAPVQELYDNSQHPYTIGLLGSLPRMDLDVEKLPNIKGSPPNLLQPLRGCPFAPRCLFAFQRCELEIPPLMMTQETHAVACWWDVQAGRERHA
jgi:oligopeptide transport system ATP-binding protein